MSGQNRKMVIAYKQFLSTWCHPNERKVLGNVLLLYTGCLQHVTNKVQWSCPCRAPPLQGTFACSAPFGCSHFASLQCIKGPPVRHCRLQGTFWVLPRGCPRLDQTTVHRVGRKWKNLSDFLCHGDVNIGYRIIPTSEIASSLRCALQLPVLPT